MEVLLRTTSYMQGADSLTIAMASQAAGASAKSHLEGAWPCAGATTCLHGGPMIIIVMIAIIVIIVINSNVICGPCSAER
jgi:hypothetical protein